MSPCALGDRRGFAPHTLARVHRWLVVTLLAWAAGPAWTAPIELVSLQRSAEQHAGIAIDYRVDVELPKTVVEVLRRGVPLQFQAQATVLRPRWYWRDERVTRATRSWRLAWQPLTSTWRVGQDGLTQQYATLDEAIASMTRVTNWLVAEPPRVQADDRYVVAFTWRLDTAQLPAPMQLEVAAAGEWNLRIDAEFGVTP